MRQELTGLGVRECRTVADVDAALTTPGVVMMVVNSVCGCAAGKARPGIAMALQHANRPDVSASVFAGADMEATDRAREAFTGFPPSSPSIALLRDGKLLYMIEHRGAIGADDRRPPHARVRQVLHAANHRQLTIGDRRWQCFDHRCIDIADPSSPIANDKSLMIV
jgi:putative YphP/YqiW family bacilliredoxin